ncbi:hypothetical protein [Microvirga sp. TS319]|uniref:hypothetical protein n=1 Tax=Microvirga sp. TS319 TaxID=3241165 RepID=UPI00351A8E58
MTTKDKDAEGPQSAETQERSMAQPEALTETDLEKVTGGNAHFAGAMNGIPLESLIGQPLTEAAGGSGKPKQ